MLNLKPFQKGDLVRIEGGKLNAVVVATVEQFNARMVVEQTRVELLFPGENRMSVPKADFKKLVLVRESTYYGDLKAGRITTEDWWRK